MIARSALAGLILCVACNRKHAEPLAAGSSAGSGSDGSDGTIEPVFRGGAQTDHTGIPQLDFAIDHIYQQQKPTEMPPYHADGGTWTYFDAHLDGDPAATFVVGVPSLDGRDAAAGPSFDKVMLAPTTAAAGARVVRAFATAFGVPVPPAVSGHLAPVRVDVAVLGHGIADKGNGYGGRGTWDATKWFFTVGDTSDIEIFFNFSLDEKHGMWSEKDPDYDTDVANALALALRDGQPAPR
jgi:hypothetical protein